MAKACHIGKAAVEGSKRGSHKPRKAVNAIKNKRVNGLFWKGAKEAKKKVISQGRQRRL